MKISLAKRINAPFFSVEVGKEDFIKSMLVHEEVGKKEDAPCWSPILWRDDKRAKANAESFSCVVLDIDEPISEKELRQKLLRCGYEAVAHETWTRGCWRVIFFAAGDAASWAPSQKFLADALGLKNDASTVDLARAYYAPSRPKGESRLSFHLEGDKELQAVSSLFGTTQSASSAAVNLEAIRAGIKKVSSGKLKDAVKELVDGRLELEIGGRSNKIFSAAHALARATDGSLSEASVRALFESALRGMPLEAGETVSTWVGVALRAYKTKAVDAQADAEARTVIQSTFGSVEEDDWRSRLLLRIGKDGERVGVKSNLANVELILDNDPEFKGRIRYDELHRKIVVSEGPIKGEQDSLDVSLSTWLARSHYNMEIPRYDCGAMIYHTALKNKFDPVSTYLNSLQWDGKERCADVLKKYCKAVGNDSFIRKISEKFFISAVARALQPGCQVDTVLVLRGEQGTRKTSFVRTIGRGFSVETQLDLGNKDAVLVATGNWVVELSELASLKKADVESIRAFITRREDQIRVPYGKSVTSHPRRCVFVGTTNSAQPLSDQEGNRRFWVVNVGDIDIDRLESDVDQIWAEAKVKFERGDKWWLEGEDVKIAAEEMDVFLAEDPVTGALVSWVERLKFENPDKLTRAYTTIELAKQAMRLEAQQINDTTIKKIGQAARRMGWKQTREGRIIRWTVA